MNLVDVVNELHMNPKVKELPNFKSGDTVAVYAKIKEGAKSRTQVFQGTVIGLRYAGKMNGCFTVRKISGGTGVERTFPFHGPNLEDVKIIQRGKARKAKLYYLRERSGKGARIAIDYERKEEK